MKTFVYIIFSIILIQSSNLYSQATEEWAARYNGPNNGTDKSHAIAFDNMGNVYVTGETSGAGTGLDFLTIKYNSLGAEIWSKTYNSPGNHNEISKAIVVDAFGNAYITGDSHGDFVTIKYDSSGIQQWLSTFDNAWEIRDIDVDNMGNVFIAGWVDLTSNLEYDYALIKYNSSGVQQWVKTYNGPGNGYDYISSLALDNTGNIYVTGQSVGSGTQTDFATIKYNTAGDVVWLKRHGTSTGHDFGMDITVDNSGNVFVTGTKSVSGSLDFGTIKYNSSGEEQWVKSYNGPGNGFDRSESIDVDANGNVYITGRSPGSGSNFDFATIKYDSSGSQQWVTRYNGSGNGIDEAKVTLSDEFGNVYVSGFSHEGATGYDYTTIKYNPGGSQEWKIHYNGNLNSEDQLSDLAIDPTGNLLVTGYSMNDFLTIKYSHVVSITGNTNEIPFVYELIQNYPNPFNPQTKIKFSIPRNNFISLKIYDILGRQVDELVNQMLSAGKHEVLWDASHFRSGIYYYKLEAADFTETKKMLLVK
jgi:uncharacterized delta-60 repeat protein